MEKRIPRRRFKEFVGSGDWEEKKLGEVADRYDNLRIPIAESKRKSGTTPYYGANGIVDYIDGFTHNGEFVLLAEDGANDLNNYPIHYVNGKVWVNNHAHVIQGIDKILKNIFLVYSLKTIDISSYLVGGSRAKLNADTMMQLNIPIPSLAEQEKIGNFFQKLDRLIDINKQKLGKLKASKSAYLTEMFPGEGEDRPRRRFQGFTGDWQEDKAKDICSISTGKSNTQDRNSDGKYPFYVRSPRIECSTKYLYNEEAVLTVGDGVGTGKVFHYVNGKYDLHQRVYRMFNFNNIMAKYFYYYFSVKFYDRVMSMTARTSVDSVRYEMISEMNILYPSMEEQIKIVKLLETFDQQIEVQEEKLEKLEKMKKAYLAEMFV